jgi:PAS domain S-box-containing protein
MKVSLPTKKASLLIKKASPLARKAQRIDFVKGQNEDAPDPILQQAFENSLQANIISIAKDGRIIRANKAACLLLGYSKKELLTRKRKDIFSISEEGYIAMLKQRKKEGGARADISIIRKNGKLWPCEVTSVIFKDAHGVSNSITSMVDRRERLSNQKKIDVRNEKEVAGNIIIAQSRSDSSQAENNDWIRSISDTAYDVTWDWDITANLVSFGKSYEKVFGYKLPKTRISFEEWMGFFLQDEGDAIKNKVNKVFGYKKESWSDKYQFTRPDGSLCPVIIRANIVRDPEGKAIRMIGVIHDLSKLQKLEGVLEEEIRIKKDQITEAIVDARETERSDIGKELHDNVNQLLGASMLYLDMARKDINNGEIYLIHSHEYTLSAIEEIRKLTKGWTTHTGRGYELCEAIEIITRDTMEVYPVKIHCLLDRTIEETMSEKLKLNLFRILQEQLNNILKHASAAVIRITLSDTQAGVIFSVADDGIGFDKDIKTDGIGIGNIISRTELYKGKVNFITAPGKGCTMVVTFPVT